MQFRGKPMRGFTLVEILVVVVILGIAAACVVPQISSRDDLKTASAARVVMADLIYAQNRAISTQQTRYINFDITNQQYQVLSGWLPQVFCTNPITKNNYVTVFSTNATTPLKATKLISASFDSQTALAFDPLGAPYSVATDGTMNPLINQATIVVQTGTNSLTITVEPYTGEINVH